MSETQLRDNAIRDLVIANRILARENVIDGFGHVSVRHPMNPDRFLLSRSRSPEIVSRDDIMEFELDGTLVSDDPRRPYAERYIHGAIYMARPEINSVSHHHAHSVIPFSLSDCCCGTLASVMMTFSFFSSTLKEERWTSTVS